MTVYDNIYLGQKVRQEIKITEEMVFSFAKLTGDNNPVHLDEEFAEKTFFRQRIAHGMLVASFISKILGTELPGPGAIYLSQNLEFKRPVYLNSTIICEVLVIDKMDKQKKVVFKTSAYNQENKKEVISGEAVVLVR